MSYKDFEKGFYAGGYYNSISKPITIDTVRTLYNKTMEEPVRKVELEPNQKGVYTIKGCKEGQIIEVSIKGVPEGFRKISEYSEQVKPQGVDMVDVMDLEPIKHEIKEGSILVAKRYERSACTHSVLFENMYHVEAEEGKLFVKDEFDRKVIIDGNSLDFYFHPYDGRMKEAKSIDEMICEKYSRSITEYEGTELRKTRVTFSFECNGTDDVNEFKKQLLK